MLDPISRVSLIKEGPGSIKVEITDSQYLRVVALIGHVDVVQIILDSTRLRYTPVRWRYIFPLVIGESGWDLRETH